MKNTVPVRDSEIDPLAAAAPRRGARWFRARSRTAGTMGVLTCAMALWVGCGGGAQSSGGAGGSGGSGSTTSTTSTSTSSSGSSGGTCGLTGDPTCLDCVSGSCCNLAEACANDPTCGGCLGNPTTACDGNSAFVGFAQCLQDKCEAECLGSSSSSSSSSSSTSSSSTSSSSSSSSTSSSSSSSSSGQPCMNNDPGEPNNSVSTNKLLGNLGCSDTNPPKLFGTLAGPNDEDWFEYIGDDGVTCLVNPTVSIAASGSGPAPKVCMYFACLSGGTDIGACPAGTTADVTAFGDPGCCGSDFTVNLDCTGSSDGSASVYMRVYDPTHTAVCTQYTLTYHF